MKKYLIKKPKLTAVLLGAAVIVVLAVSWSPVPSTPVLERLYYVSQTIAIPVACVAGVLVLLQVVELRKSQEYHQFEMTAARISHISELALSHPNEYEDLSKSAESTGARFLAEAILDVMDTELLRYEHHPERFGDLPSLKTYFSDLLRDLPGLKKTLEEKQSWYSNELLALSRSDESQGRQE